MEVLLVDRISEKLEKKQIIERSLTSAAIHCFGKDFDKDIEEIEMKGIGTNLWKNNPSNKAPQASPEIEILLNEVEILLLK